MSCRSVIRSVFIALALGIGSSASAGVLWDETINGDLSNSGLTPTFLGTLTAGSNQVFGLTGRPPTATTPERDYFFISVPFGLSLASIKVLAGTTVGNLGFIALGAGSTITVSPTAGTAAGLLGWHHYSLTDIGDDILPSIGNPLFLAGSSGFTPPLGAGNYAFWVQDTTTTETPFNFRFDITAVPEPGTIAMLLLGLGGLGFMRRRRSKICSLKASS